VTDNPPARPTRTRDQLADVVGGARVDPSVFELRPDYRVLLIAIDGLPLAPRDTRSEELISHAEQGACQLLASQPVERVPHVAAWREAYRAFGAKPQRTRNSLEALLRRAGAGLPRINRLTDIYNAVSVQHQIPLGGENLNRHVGAPRLIRATGAESFVTIADGTDR
jgi:DNA/RNA-binding domain of Phe-tRNA-synthetase-like protein